MVFQNHEVEVSTAVESLESSHFPKSLLLYRVKHNILKCHQFYPCPVFLVTYLISLSCSGCLQRKGLWFKLNRCSTQGLRALYLRSGRSSTEQWMSPPSCASRALFSAPLTTSCHPWAQPLKPLPPPPCSTFLNHFFSTNLNISPISYLPYLLLFSSVTWFFSFFLQIILLFFFLNSSLHPHCYSACNGKILPLWTGMQVGTEVLRKASRVFRVLELLSAGPVPSSNPGLL